MSKRLNYAFIFAIGTLIGIFLVRPPSLYGAMNVNHALVGILMGLTLGYGFAGIGEERDKTKGGD